MKANTWKDDAAKVKHCMSLTADYRMHWIKEGTEKTLADILEECPCLLDPGMVSIYNPFSFYNFSHFRKRLYFFMVLKVHDSCRST